MLSIARKMKRSQQRPRVAYGTTVTTYKEYCFTEEWEGNIPVPSDAAKIYVETRFYDVFQYILNYIRELQYRFAVIPIDVYKANFSVFVGAAAAIDYEFSACTQQLEDGSWIIAVPRYIGRRELFMLGHEVAHVVLDNLPVNDGTSQAVHLQAEYDADKWSCGVLELFGVYTRQEAMTRLEISQLRNLERAGKITKEQYGEVVGSPAFTRYDRSSTLFSDVLAGEIMKGIGAVNPLKILEQQGGM